MIEVEGLGKTFGRRRPTLALDDVSFQLAKGSRLGVLGARTAGKSTLLQILATALQPSRGSARIGDHDIVADRGQVQEIIGYTPQDLELHGWPSGSSYLRFWARVSGLDPSEQEERMRHVVEFLELGAEIEGDPTLYTVELQKRLSLAQALLTQPDVLLLDEILTAGTEGARDFFTDRLAHLASGGTTVVLTSPFLEDVRASCDQVAVMSEGRLTQVFRIEKLLTKIGEGKDARVFVDCDGLSPTAAAALKQLPGVIDVRTTPTTTVVYITPLQVTVETIRTTLEAQGVTVRSARAAQLKLGDVFSALQA